MGRDAYASLNPPREFENERSSGAILPNRPADPRLRLKDDGSFGGFKGRNEPIVDDSSLWRLFAPSAVDRSERTNTHKPRVWQSRPGAFPVREPCAGG